MKNSRGFIGSGTVLVGCISCACSVLEKLFEMKLDFVFLVM